jgi:hypothetical protein
MAGPEPAIQAVMKSGIAPGFALALDGRVERPAMTNWWCCFLVVALRYPKTGKPLFGEALVYWSRFVIRKSHPTRHGRP